ncbi:MAG: transglycosylase SLT domain-containing protein [Paludibacteraceae bacterium]|nr:transglycosylase SLT domain-containing protein [Paludibacteraceae bacterium]MBR6686825.1 transglycosylase SLT domain-containing protein [Paludibacteraceae bacterium]
MINFDNYIPAPKAEFCSKLQNICDKLHISPEWLLAVMYVESRINPYAVNKYSGATGLIQFIPATAKSLGTTTTELLNMTAVDQLDYVYLYLKPYTGKMHSLMDVYFAIFFPAAIGKPSDYVLQTSKLSASLIASQNPAYDINSDGDITVAEVESKIYKILGLVPPKKNFNLVLFAGAAILLYNLIF